MRVMSHGFPYSHEGNHCEVLTCCDWQDYHAKNILHVSCMLIVRTRRSHGTIPAVPDVLPISLDHATPVGSSGLLDRLSNAYATTAALRPRRFQPSVVGAEEPSRGKQDSLRKGSKSWYSHVYATVPNKQQIR